MGVALRARPNLNPLVRACGLVTLCAARASLAGGADYRLQVVRAEGAGSCPSASVIERDVSERLGRRAFSDAGERGIEVVVERTETKWVARLYLRVDASAADPARLIESDAPDCDDLGKSVALAVALAIAPELPPEPPAVVTPKPQSQPQQICPPPAPAPPRPSAHGEASLRALFSPNLLPSPSVGAALAVTLRGDLFGASFGGIFFPQSTLRTSETQLGFGLSVAFASACLWARTRDPQVWSCLGARFGVLHSVVYSPRPENPGDRLWAGASTELGLRKQLWGRLFAEAGAAAIFPLVRDRFAVDPRPAPVYEQGSAVVEGFAGLGLHLD